MLITDAMDPSPDPNPDPSPNPDPDPSPTPHQVLSVALGDSIYLWNASDGSIQQLMQVHACRSPSPSPRLSPYPSP